jgi:DUF917 family protein
MTLENQGRRLATFPDLIATVDAVTGLPLPTADLRNGAQVALVIAPASRLILGAGMRDRELFAEAEKAVGLDITRYAFK